MGVSLIDGHVDPPYLWVVYDIEGASSYPIYGVFTSRRKAFEAIEEITMRCVEDMLADDPKETGISEDNRSWLIKDTKRSFAVQVLHNGIDTIHYSCDIESPLV